MTVAGDLLRRAATLVEGDRAEQNGDVVVNASNIARFWSAYLTSKFGHEVQLSASDALSMMEMFKIARRLSGAFNADDYLDSGGYASLAYQCALAERKLASD